MAIHCTVLRAYNAHRLASSIGDAVWWRAVEYADGRRGRQISPDGETWTDVI
jgi:hypothetical protein